MLKQPFLKLPIRFDAAALEKEVRALPAEAWTPHPTGYVGNEAVRLVTPSGRPADDLRGSMAPTEWLRRCDYIRKIMATIGAVWGRSRLMGLAAGREVPSHIDINYYWRTHLRIHIPVITNPGVLFTCGDQTEHMAAGECWIFDSFRWHDVQNKGAEQRIHLVVDTVGGGLLPELMCAAEAGTSEPRFIGPGGSRPGELLFENVNSPKIMSPWEMRCHVAFIREQAGSSRDVLRVLERLDAFINAWAAAWARFGDLEEGRPVYTGLLEQARVEIAQLGAEHLALPNALVLNQVLEELVFVVAIRPIQQKEPTNRPIPSQPSHNGRGGFRDRFERPVFIVSTPRSGSTLLYETLQQAPDLYSTGDESHWIIEGLEGLSPPQRSWSSNRLEAEDANPEVAEKLAESFYRHLTNREGKVPSGRVRMLEKTPKNALRVPFFNAIWPDARFIYLYRDVRETFHSMLEAWRTGGFVTYPQLPAWRGAPWSMLLVPGWQRLNGMKLPEAVAHQWAITTETLLDDLEKLDPSRIDVIDYSAFLRSPQTEIERIAMGVELSWDRSLGEALPLSRTTISAPEPEKWRRIAQVIEAIWPIVERADQRARDFVLSRGATVVAADEPFKPDHRLTGKARRSQDSIEEVAGIDLRRACDLAREWVAAEPFSEKAAITLRRLVERFAQEAPVRPDPDANLPAPLVEATMLLLAGEDEPAEVILRKYVAEYPADVRAMAMMAEVAARSGFFEEAHRILLRALQVDPNCVDALLGLAKLLNHLSFIHHGEDRGDEALKILERALEIDPSNIHVVSLYSSILVRFRRVKESVPWYDRLLNLDPCHWMAWANYGTLLNSLGNFGRSIAALRTAAALNPQYALSWWEIANLKVSKLFGSDVAQMREVLTDENLDAQSRSYIHFALGKAFDQAGSFEMAAEQLRIANEIKREIEPYDPDKVTSDVQNSERIFTPQFFADRRDFGDQHPDPIFIIGLQRAGTTLVEQILSSHSQIEGTEELFFVLQLATELSQRNPGLSWQEALARGDASAVRDLGQAYLRLAGNHRLSTRPLFIDKNPANWRFAGLIATILPNAKIVDVRRNPMDCCFGNYTQHYENGVGFSYSLSTAARYYSDYVRLMRHFSRIAPGRIHRIIYDDMVDDFESNVRRLLEYVGLPFEETCLRFYETDRLVLTPSSQQVREPINRKGFGRWRNYEPWIGELKAGLAELGTNWRS